MKLLFGCGYLGSRVARLWQAAGEPVTIVTRHAEKAAQFRAQGYEAIVADVCDPVSLGKLPPAETVLYAVGYDRKSSSGGAGRTIHEVYADGVRNVLERMGSGATNIPHSPFRIPHFLYISSTGVYGDADGDWVDEATPCRPLREGGKACLAAEQAIAAHPRGANAVVLRLAGLYGPDRIPRSDALKRGEPIDAPADGFLNLIHVDDAARIVLDIERLALTDKIAMPRTYCVADGNPGLRREYYAELARLLGAPPPRFTEPVASSPAAQRAAADKRISNARLVREVSPTFAYSSYREGLATIIKSGPRIEGA